LDELSAPAEPLRPFIEGYWHRCGCYEPPKNVRVVADACTKLIFELAPVPWPSAYLIGTQLSPIVVALCGEVDRVGIRFRPGMAGFLLRCRIDDLPRPLAPLAELAVPDGGRILDALRCADPGFERVRLLDHWLLAQLPLPGDDRDELDRVAQVARLLGSGRSAPETAAALGWPERRLQRLCRKRFGAPAATLHRLYRFERLLRRCNGKPAPLADLAASLGFADQAHMARDFRDFAGLSISAFLRDRATVGNVQDAAAWLPVLRGLPEDL
jgi:AraC-like DNA-binding protein